MARIFEELLGKPQLGFIGSFEPEENFGSEPIFRVYQGRDIGEKTDVLCRMIE